MPSLIVPLDSGASVERVAIDDGGGVIATAHSRERVDNRYRSQPTPHVGSESAPIRVWDRRTGALRAQLPRPGTTPVLSRLEFMPGGERYLLAEGGALRVYDLRTNEIVLDAEGRALGWAPSGGALAYRHQQHICVWTAERGQRCLGEASAYAWSASGILAYSRPDEPAVRTFDPRTARERVAVRGEGNRFFSSLLWHPDNRRLLTQDTHDDIQLWDAEHGRSLWRVEIIDGPAPVFALHGRVVVVSGASGGSVLDSDSGAPVRPFRHFDEALRGHNGAVVTVRALRVSSITNFDVETGEELASLHLRHGSAPSAGQNGLLLFVHPDLKGALCQPDGRIEAMAPAQAGAVSSNGDWIVVAREQGIFVRAATGTRFEAAPIVEPDLANMIEHLTWSRDGQVLAFAQRRAAVRFFTATQAAMASRPFLRGVASLSLSADGSVLAAGAFADGAISAWGADGRGLLRTNIGWNPNGEDPPSPVVRITADGALVATDDHVLPISDYDMSFVSVEAPLTLCSDGRSIIGALGQSMVALDLVSGRETVLAGVEPRTSREMDCSSDGQFVTDTLGHVWSLPDGHVREIAGFDAIMRRGHPYSLQVGGDARRVAVHVGGGAVALISMVGAPRVTAELEACRELALGDDGLIACVRGTEVLIQRPNTADRTVAFDAPVTSVAWRPGHALLVVAADGLWWLRPDGVRLRLLVIPVGPNRHIVAMDDEGHFDGPEDALRSLWVRLGDGPNAPVRRASELPSRRRPLFRQWLATPRRE